MNIIKNKPFILRRDVLICLFLIVITLAVYWQVRNHEFVSYDDDVYVIENPTLRSSDGLRRIWFVSRALPQYYPLVHTTFWKGNS